MKGAGLDYSLVCLHISITLFVCVVLLIIHFADEMGKYQNEITLFKTAIAAVDKKLPKPAPQSLDITGALNQIRTMTSPLP